MILRIALLLVLQVLLFCRVCAQLPPRLERCLPYPTLAEEISAMRQESLLRSPGRPHSARVIIASIRFAPGTRISYSLRKSLISQVKSVDFYDDSERSWLKEMQEVGVRGTLQDSGYMLAKATVSARLLDGNARRVRYALTFFIDEGLQYRLAHGVQFESAANNAPLVFSTSELRYHIGLNPGEFFSASKIRNGLEEIRKLYGSRGYIDTTAEPQLLNYDDGPLFDLTITVDQEKQYRLGKVEFLGLDEKAQSHLRPQLKSGDVFDPSMVDELLKQNKSILPSDASGDDVRIWRDAKHAIVSISFDFYSCPK